LTERTGSFEIVNATNTCYLDHHCIISTEFEVKLYSLRPLKFKKTLYSKQDVIRSIDVSSRGLVCIGSDDPTLYFVNIFNPSYSESLNGHKKPVKNLKFNEEGDILVSCSAEGIMNVFALELGKWKLSHWYLKHN
jgi:WD40 repeat protein